MRNYKSFTMAETLITLTILGVIATLTISNLVRTYKKTTRLTQIKKAYALLDNAIQMSIIENGSPSGWVTTYSDPNFPADYNNISAYAMDRYIIPYLDVQLKCFSKTKSNFKKDCFISGDSVLYLNSGGYRNPISSVILKNGMHVGAYPDANGIIRIYVDVNGKTGPSKVGDDVFVFQINLRDNSTFDKKGTVTPYKYIHLNDNLNSLMNTTNDYCSCNVNCKGECGNSCARAIMRNEWKFPDNYPIKNFH